MSRWIIVDTTVAPKNVTFPTDAKLIHRAREKLVSLARKVGVDLRQSYRRVGKLALIKYQRYAHAHQFKRAGKALRKLKTYLGPIQPALSVTLRPVRDRTSVTRLPSRNAIEWRSPPFQA